MPGIPNSSELFLTLMVYYRITDTTGKIMGKTEFLVHNKISLQWCIINETAP